MTTAGWVFAVVAVHVVMVAAVAVVLDRVGRG